MPIILIVSVGFWSSMDRNSRVKFSNIILFVVLLFNLSWMPRTFPIKTNHVTIPEVRDNWAIWGAQHLEGKVVIVEGGDILKIAQAMARGEIEYRKGNFDVAFEHLREGVELDDRLNYDEPWGWMQPVRHALGALLLEQGHLEEAEKVLR